MKSDQKLDLDATLARWPAPARDDAAWESRAEAIVAAAVAASSGAGEAASALLSAPLLAAEAGEPGGGGVSAESAAVRGGAVGPEGPGSGERKMSDGTNQGDPKDPGPPASEQPRKKQSLKDIATRASQSGRASIPSSAPTSATATPVPRSATATPIPSSRAVEAKADDSGMVDLKVVQATVTPQQVAAAEKAKPGSADLFEDDEKVEGAPAAKPAGRAVAAKKAPPPPPPQRGGVVIAIGLAAVGVAAAVMIMMRGTGEPPASKPTAESHAVETAAPAATAAQAAASAEAAPAEVAAAEAPSASPVVDSKGGPGASAAASGDTGKVAAADKPALGGPMPAGTAAPAAKGDLASQMAAATGADKNKGGAPDSNPEPAAGGGSKNSSVPEKPPQGSVQAAIRAVSGNAKACVAGADDISRANVTFGSNGAVTSVSVSGWAAGKGAAGCIKTALKGANVGAFSSPSFTVTVPIRP